MTTFPMKTSAAIAAGFLGLGFAAFAQAPAKVTYTDHIEPIFRNACTNCHNPDKKKAGLDLTTYQATMAGSENGPVLKPGNPDGSLMYKVCLPNGDPKMPPKGDQLSEADTALLKGWIAGFALENANSKPAQVAQNKVDVAVVSLTKPDGPPPMPGDLPLEPFVRSRANNAIIAMAASPWAPVVAVGGQKQVLLYNTESLERLGILAFPEGFPNVLRFSRNAKLLLAGGGLGGKLGKVVLWDVATGERIGVVGNEADAVLAADISPDQQYVALGGPNKQVKIYSTKTGRQTGLIKKHTEWITAIAYSPDGRYLATADRNGGVEVWEAAAEPKPFNTLPGHKVACTALAFMPGVLASASEDGKVSLWNVKEGTEIRSWNAHGGGVLCVDFTPDGRLVSCGRDKVAKVWDGTGKQLAATEAFADLTLRCTLNSDRVIAADWTGDIRVYGLDGRRLGSLTANPPGIAEQLAEAEKVVTETQAALPGLQKALADAEARVKAEREAAEAKRKADLAAAEQRKTAAQGAIDAAKAAPGNAQKAAEAAKSAVAAAQDALSATRKSLSEVEAAAASRKRADAEKAAAAAKAKLDGFKAELAKRTEALAKIAKEAPEFAKAEQEVKAITGKIGEAEQAFAAAEKTVAGIPVPPGKDKVDAAKAAVASAQQKVEEARKKAQQAQAELTRINGAAPKLVAEAEKSFQAAQADIARLQGPQKREPSLELVKRVAELQKRFDALTADLNQLRNNRAKFKEGTPDYTKADAAVQGRKPDLAKVEKELADAKAAAAGPQPTEAEKALDKVKADLTAAEGRLALGRTRVAGWKRAQLYQTVFNARQTVATKQAKYDDALATAKDAFRQVELAKQGIAAAEKTIAEGPKVIAEKEQALASATQAAEALKAKVSAAEKAVADKKAALTDPKPIEAEVAAATKKLEGLNAEIAKRREAREKIAKDSPDYAKADAAVQAMKPDIDKAEAELKAAKAKKPAKPGEEPVPAELTDAVNHAHDELKLAHAKLAPAEKALAAARQAVDEAKKQLASLKAQIPKLEADAVATKAEAEKATVVLAKELEAAKSEAEKVRAQYDAAKNASQKAASTSSTLPPKS
jgi:hypothetical protein